MKVLLCGYSGHCPERLREICVELNAVVFDVRLKPYSKDSRWSAPELAALLGERYVGLPQWGNPAKLDCPDERTFPAMDWAGGLRIFKMRCGDRRAEVAILLCGCRSITECHRAAIGKRLAAEERYDVRDMNHWNTPEKARALPLARELAEVG